MLGPHTFALGARTVDTAATSPGQFATAESSRDFLRGARIDSAWILRKLDTEFNDEVMQNLKKAVYAVGQGGHRWFSGGGELSGRQASAILDYIVLVELLLQRRDDLYDYRGDLADCRDQLLMQVSRYTEGQTDRVTGLVDSLVREFHPQAAT